jgi:hypothetical protein
MHDESNKWRLKDGTVLYVVEATFPPPSSLQAFPVENQYVVRTGTYQVHVFLLVLVLNFSHF